MIVWGLGGKIVRTVLSYAVFDSCIHSDMHTRVNSSPAKAREYVFTVVGLSVCLCVCLRPR